MKKRVALPRVIMSPNVMSAIISSKSNSGLNNTGLVEGFSLMFVAGVEFIIAMTRSLKQGVVSHDLIFTRICSVIDMKAS